MDAVGARVGMGQKMAEHEGAKAATQSLNPLWQHIVGAKRRTEWARQLVVKGGHKCELTGCLF